MMLAGGNILQPPFKITNCDSKILTDYIGNFLIQLLLYINDNNPD